MIQTKNIKKILNNNEIIFPDINLEKGKVLFLKGISGSGKTTFMKILAKLDKNFKGELIMNIDEKNIGYYFNDYFLIPEFSLEENILFLSYGYEKNKLKEKIDEIAKKLDIENFLKTNIKKLSSGQYQRLSLLRTFLGKKDFYILDEATSHLDKNSAEKIYDYIIELKKEGKTFCISSHNQNTINYLSQKIPSEDFIILQL